MSTRIKDVMTKDVVNVRDSDTLRTVARQMRDRDIGDVIVLDHQGGLCGILTDRDIVVRAVADGLDPAVASAGDVCSRHLETLPPEATVNEAVERMRNKAIRRLIVAQRGNVVGIVSIGDLAQAREPESALGQISAAPPNA